MILANKHFAGTRINFPSAILLDRLAIQNIISVFFFESRLQLRQKLLPQLCPSIYRGLMISSYQDTDRIIHHDNIYPDIQIGRYLALTISRYLIGCNASKPFDWLRISFLQPLFFLSPKNGEKNTHGASTSNGKRETKTALRRSLFHRTVLDLCGSKRSNFPKKIGASGGWAEPHLLALTVP